MSGYVSHINGDKNYLPLQTWCGQANPTTKFIVYGYTPSAFPNDVHTIAIGW